MRNIKFRAWENWDNADTGMDKIDLPKKIISWKEMLEWNKASFGDAISNKRGELTLMQFTGLKDKNEKDIYEGDIVEVCKSGGKNKKIYLVIFKKMIGGFYLSRNFLRKAGEEGIGKNITNNFGKVIGSVIGNKFENPELLGAEKEAKKK